MVMLTQVHLSFLLCIVLMLLDEISLVNQKKHKCTCLGTLVSHVIMLYWVLCFRTSNEKKKLL